MELSFATGCTVRGSNPGGGEISFTGPDRLCSPPSLVYSDLKLPECGVNHQPPSSAEVKESVELYLCSVCGLSWPVLGCALPLPILYGPVVRHAMELDV